MTCYRPIQGWLSKDLNRNGLRPMVFNSRLALAPDEPMNVPCGKCVGCRLKRSRDWAIRCVHEASLHNENAFISLTFSPAALALRSNPYSVFIRDFQLFMKRLRERISPIRIRYFHSGEYGSINNRPHYHAIIFGYDFPDKYFFQMKNGNALYRSPLLESVWPHGYSSIGAVTFQSAAYVARYIMKKVTGDKAEEHYSVQDGLNTYQLEPEYCSQSRRPGIASDWIKKYFNDVYPSDYVVFNNKRYSPPPFYDKMLHKLDKSLYYDIKEARNEDSRANYEEDSLLRLEAKERAKALAIARLERNLDKDDEI